MEQVSPQASAPYLTLLPPIPANPLTLKAKYPLTPSLHMLYTHSMADLRDEPLAGTLDPIGHNKTLVQTTMNQEEKINENQTDRRQECNVIQDTIIGRRAEDEGKIILIESREAATVDTGAEKASGQRIELGRISQETKSSPEAIQKESKAEPDNILKILSDLQAEINDLRSRNMVYEGQLNQFRLGLFIPRTKHEVDIMPVATKLSWNFVDILKQPDGLETAQNIYKVMIEFSARASDLIDQYKSKQAINLSLDDKDRKAKDTVKKERAKSSPEGKSQRLMLTAAEKAVRGFITTANKMSGGKTLTQAQLVPVVKAFMPSMTDDDIKATLESLFLKMAKSKG